MGVINMNDFYSLVTNKGLEKQVALFSQGKSLTLTHIAFGDGNGESYDPTGEELELKNEKFRNTINRVVTDSNNKNTVIIEGVLPASAGSFWVREVGIFDADGDLFAIGKFPETYKPVINEGAIKDLTVRMILSFSNKPNVSLIYNSNLGNESSLDEEILMRNFSNISEDGENYLAELFANKIAECDMMAKGLGNITAEGVDYLETLINTKISKYMQDHASEFQGGDEDVGIIVGSPLSSLPKALLCDGGAISRTTYARLFNKIGTTYGTGDGSTTFNKPDFRGCFLRGYMNGRSNAIGTLQGDGLPNITGQVQTNPYVTYPTGKSGALSSSTTGTKMTVTLQSGSGTINKSGFIKVNAADSNSIYGASSYVTPYNHAINWFIKY